MSTDYSSRDFKRKFEKMQAGDQLPPSLTALAQAAMTSADAIGDAAFVAFKSQGFALQKDGCDFLSAIYFYLVKMGCPGVSCDYVAVVTGLSDGNSEEEYELTDEFLSGVMNVSTRTIQTKRARLIQWMRDNKFPVLGITEGEYNHKKKRNSPTRYRAILAPIAAKIVFMARSGKVWAEEPRAKTKAIAEAAEEEVWQTPEAPVPVKKRKQKKQKPPSKEIEQRRKGIITNFLKIVRLTFKQDLDPLAMWEELKFDMEHACNEEVRIMTETGGVF
jgi:hypothetical protein